MRDELVENEVVVSSRGDRLYTPRYLPEPPKKPKRNHGEGSVYFRKNRGKWVVQFEINGETETASFDTEKEAEAYRKKTAYKYREEHIKPANRQMTVYKYAVQCLSLRSNITPNVRATYAAHMERHIKDTRLGKMKIADVESSDIRQFLRELQKAKHKPSYIIHILTPIRQAFKQAMLDQDIPRNPFDGVEMPQPDKTNGKALTRDEVARFYETVRSDRYANRNSLLYEILFTYGLRVGEGIGLRWSDLDIRNPSEPTLRVDESVKREVIEDWKEEDKTPKTRVVFGDPKTKASKAILPISPEHAQQLHQLKLAQNEVRLASGEQWVDYDLIFCTYPSKAGGWIGGKPLEISNVRRQYKRLLEQAGIEVSKLHNTRHTAITRISEAGTQIEVTTELGRYADARTPQRYYIHVTEERKRKAMTDYLRNLQTNLVGNVEDVG